MVYDIFEGMNWKIGNVFIYNEMFLSVYYLLIVIVWIVLIGILLLVVLIIFFLRIIINLICCLKNEVVKVIVGDLMV